MHTFCINVDSIYANWFLRLQGLHLRIIYLKNAFIGYMGPWFVIYIDVQVICYLHFPESETQSYHRYFVDVASDMRSCDCSVSNVTCHWFIFWIQFPLHRHVKWLSSYTTEPFLQGGGVNKPDLTLVSYLHLMAQVKSFTSISVACLHGVKALHSVSYLKVYFAFYVTL